VKINRSESGRTQIDIDIEISNCTAFSNFLKLKEDMLFMSCYRICRQLFMLHGT